MRWEEQKRKSLMFGSIKVDVKVHKDKHFPKNETVMALLTEILGNPVVGDVPFDISYTVHKDFMQMELLIQSFNRKKVYDSKVVKNRIAMELLYMASDALEREGWTRVSTDGDEKVLRYVYVLVG